MGRPVVHFEFWSKDTERLGAFYSRVFGWEIRHVPELNYHFISTGEGGLSGGMMTPKEGHWPANVALYIDVDDLASATREIVAAGGTLIVDRAEVPGMGVYAIFQDTDGRVLGAWQRSR